MSTTSEIEVSADEQRARLSILQFLESWPDESLGRLVQVRLSPESLERSSDANLAKLGKLLTFLKERNTKHSRFQLRAIRQALTDMIDHLAFDKVEKGK